MRMSFCLLMLAVGGVLPAQQPLPGGYSLNPAVTSPTTTPSVTSTPATLKPTEVTGTPEMWFYEQERRRYDDPNAMARARAEFEANQRQARLAAQKWYGYSNSRPRAGTDPVHGTYGPRWVGNQFYPNEWSATPTIPAYGYGSGIIAIDRVRR